MKNFVFEGREATVGDLGITLPFDEDKMKMPWDSEEALERMTKLAEKDLERGLRRAGISGANVLSLRLVRIDHVTPEELPDHKGRVILNRHDLDGRKARALKAKNRDA